MSSLIYLFTFSIKGFSKISIKLHSRCVSHAGPATVTMGRDLFPGIFTHIYNSDFIAKRQNF